MPSSLPATAPLVALSTSSCYPESAAAAFELAARLGYDGVEVMVMGDPISQDASTIARLSRHYRMPVLAVHAPTLLISQRVWSPDPARRLQLAAEMALRLEAQVLVAHPPFLWQRDYAAGFADQLDGLADSAGGELRLTVENMYPWRVGRAEIPAYLPHWSPLDQPYGHITLDASHAATAGDDVVDLATRLGPRVAHVHLGDGSGSARDEHLEPGTGRQPVGALLDHLVDHGYQGIVTVEVSTRRAADRPARQAVLDRSLRFARSRLAVPFAGRAGHRGARRRSG